MQNTKNMFPSAVIWWLTLCMFSEVIVFEVLALVKKTHTPVSGTSLPSVTNTLDLVLRSGCWATCCEETDAAAAANLDMKQRRRRIIVPFSAASILLIKNSTFVSVFPELHLVQQSTCFCRLRVLIVEHEMRETFSHKELLHTLNLQVWSTIKK